MPAALSRSVLSIESSSDAHAAATTAAATVFASRLYSVHGLSSAAAAAVLAATAVQFQQFSKLSARCSAIRPMLSGDSAVRDKRVHLASVYATHARVRDAVRAATSAACAPRHVCLQEETAVSPTAAAAEKDAHLAAHPARDNPRASHPAVVVESLQVLVGRHAHLDSEARDAGAVRGEQSPLRARAVARLRPPVVVTVEQALQAVACAHQ
jgi:hypothetical protein